MGELPLSVWVFLAIYIFVPLEVEAGAMERGVELCGSLSCGVRIDQKLEVILDMARPAAHLLKRGFCLPADTLAKP